MIEQIRLYVCACACVSVCVCACVHVCVSGSMEDGLGACVLNIVGEVSGWKGLSDGVLEARGEWVSGSE